MRVRKYSLMVKESGEAYLRTDVSKNYQELDRANSPYAVAKLMDDVFQICSEAEEHLYALAYTGQKLTGVFEISHGVPHGTLSSPRNIFARVLQCNASYFILIHNHPGGNLNPSSADFETAYKLIELSKMMECPMQDFIITIRDENGMHYWSMSEQGMITQ